MTRRQAKRRAYELAANYLRADMEAGAELSEDPAEYQLLEAAMREIIDSLLARSRASYVMVWGTPEMAKVTMPVPPLQSWLKEARK